MIGLGAALACSQAPAPAPDVVGVDADDVLCDPLDEVADDDGQPATATPEPLIQWVDPMIGTGGVAFGVGTTYPGPQVPGGMVRLGPDTSHNGSAIAFMHCSGYAADDDIIDGFSHFRLHGAGIADYGGAALMPIVGMTADKAMPRGHGSPFAHAREKASPGYYAVTLDDTNVRAELTATARVAFHRYTFPKGVDATVLVDAGHLLADGNSIALGHVDVDAQAHEVRGFSHIVGSYSDRFGGIRLYFVARFTRPFTTFGTFDTGVLDEGTATKEGKDVGAYVRFDATTDGNVEAHVGVSFVDVTHAAQNLDAEDLTFDAARAQAEAAWEARLGRARIEARSDADRRIFYTALYHTAMMPALASDVDGSYRGIDGAVHVAKGFRYFTDFSLWDTYRTLHPFVTLLYPEDARDFAQSLVAMGQDGGYLPRWPIGTGESGGMIGDGATVVLADTFVKGITGWDAKGGYDVAKRQATVPSDARDGLAPTLEYGYIPDDVSISSSVAKTLEYAAADHALGEWAAALGEKADADAFHARGKAWMKLYDPVTHFLLPRRKDGTFVETNPVATGGAYTEGSAWHYNFMVPHDVAGLEEAMTRPVLLGRVEQLFTRFACSGKAAFLPNPYYWPANEPVLFSGWVFAAAGDRVRASRWLRWTTLTHFTEGPAGLPGNDDSGTMSAFYLFAALGFYPIPGTTQYVLGTPLFPRATLTTPAGTLTIEAPGASKKTRFVKSVTRNGAVIGASVAHADLLGSTLHYEMSR